MQHVAGIYYLEGSMSTRQPGCTRGHQPESPGGWQVRNMGHFDCGLELRQRYDKMIQPTCVKAALLNREAASAARRSAMS